MWHYVSIPAYTFAMRSENGKVVEVAPIAKWAIGKTTEEVIRYFSRKSGSVIQELDITEDKE